MRLPRPLVLLALLSACAQPPPPRLADFEGPVTILFADASGATSAWMLTLDPPRPDRAETGVLKLSAPIGSRAAEVLSRRFPSGSCPVEIGISRDYAGIHALPHVEDDSLHLAGRLEGDRYCGDVIHASDAGLEKLGSFHATLRKR